MHERRMNPVSFENEMIETDINEAEARETAEGQRLMELFRRKGPLALDADAFIKRVRREVDQSG